MVGPPGGLAAPPLAPLAPPPPALSLPPAPILDPGPGHRVHLSVQETEYRTQRPVPPPLGGSPGGALPGAGVPLALPDLHGVARAAIESVVREGPADARPAHGPAVIDLAQRARAALQSSGSIEGQWGAPIEATELSGHIGYQTPHVAPAPPPAQPGAQLPAPGVWGPPTRRPAPLPPPPGPRPRDAWPEVPGERDLAQRFGDRLYPLVERIRDSRAGWIGVVLLFGITVPIILLRQDFDPRARLIASFVVFFIWLSLLPDL